MISTSSQYMYTNLHTKSSYMGDWFPDFSSGKVNDQNYLNSLKNAIDALKSRENAFANKFGYTNCEELIKAMGQLFTNGFEKDLQVLERYESDNLRAALHKNFDNKTIMLKGKKVRLILDSSKTEDQLKKIKGELEKTFGFTIEDKDFKITSQVNGNTSLDIGLDWDVPNVKRVVNLVQGKHFVYNTNDKRSASDYRLVEYLRNSPKPIVQLKNKKGKTYPYEFRTSPLAYKGKELDNLPEEEQRKFGDLIYSFITVTLASGASMEMKNAISQVWNQNIGKINLKFFAGGEGWVDHLVGALGEFVTPVFFYYCSARLPNSHLIPNFMRLVGQEYNRFNEQKSMDIEISFLRAAGIQVKNYNGAFVKDKAHKDTSKERKIDVNLHPSDISSLTHDDRIVPYMVNSYFNTSIKQIDEATLQNFFEYHAYEFLNLAIDDSQIEDRVTFYLIGGYLIPGSSILEAAFQTQTIKVGKTTIHLKRNAKQGDDSLYNDTYYIEGKRPLFTDWWRGNQYIGWTPTDDNNLTKYESNILIHTDFTYSALFKAEYKIF